jgi:adenylyltransferase/sulfurtransferase
MPDDLSRYARQMRFAPLGDEGQRRLVQSRALVCGCGALGSFVANLLVRAGVGALRIVDRDFVETSNLQRQVLFDEHDAAAGLPKAVAAAEKLARINSTVRVEPVVADLDPRNIDQLADGADVIVDGTDNFETRFLINDFAVSRRRPWVYGGCLGAEGQMMTILPGEGPCLRCLIPDCPPAGSTPTCDTAGILGPTVGFIASLEALEALKILSGNRAAVSRSLTVVDLWNNRLRQVDVASLAGQTDCPACRRGEFPWLAGRAASRSAVLCGRNAVQLTPVEGPALDLAQLEQRLQGVGDVQRNPYLLRFKADAYEITVFPDGRAIVSGTDDPATARTVFARFVGS